MTQPKPVLEPAAQALCEAAANPPYLFDLGPVQGRKAVDEGMVSLRRSGLMKVRDGVTTLEEVVRETVK